MAQESTKQFSLLTLTSMVVGSMVGAGIFSLPQVFGRVTGPFGAMIAWIIAGVGMLMLAFVFQSLSMRKPDLDSGVYAYARAGFGSYMGFASALGYWASACLGNVSYFVLIKSTLGAFIPAFGEGNTIAAIFISSILLWAFHFMILRGVKQAAFINVVATVAKIIPIGIFIIFLIYGFNADIFALNFWGGEEVNLRNIFSQVRGTMLATVFVFLGIEGASVYSRYARKRSDIGLATILGFLGVLCLLVLVTILSYGILLRPELAALRNPSMAGVLRAIVGPWGTVFISAGLIISVLGAYLSWSLLAAEVLYSAAKSKTMPAFLSKENACQVPASAVWLTSSLIQIFLILSFFAEYAFTLALEFTSAMSLIPYLLVAAYGLKLAWQGEAYEAEPQYRRGDLIRAGIATLYALGLIYAGGMKFLLLSSIIYAPGSILFFIARREQQQRFLTPVEWVAFLGICLAAIAAVYTITAGLITI